MNHHLIVISPSNVDYYQLNNIPAFIVA